MDQYDEDDLEIDLGLGDAGDDAAQAASAAPEAPVEEPSTSVPLGDLDASEQQATQAAAPVKAEGGPVGGEPNPDDKTLALVQAAGDPGGAAPSREGFGCVVYVTGLDWWTTDVEVEQACQQAGTVVSLKFFEDRSNGKCMGSCAVEFTSNAEAKLCIQKLHGGKVGEQEVNVTWPGKGRFYKPRPPTEGEMGDMLGAGRGRGRGRGGFPMGMEGVMGPRMPMPPMGMMDPMAMGMLGPPMGPPMMGMMPPMVGPPGMHPGMGMMPPMGMEGMDRKRHRPG